MILTAIQNQVNTMIFIITLLFTLILGLEQTTMLLATQLISTQIVQEK